MEMRLFLHQNKNKEMLMDNFAKEIIIGAINQSPSEVEKGFNAGIKTQILDRIEAKRAEVGSNVLQQARRSSDD